MFDVSVYNSVDFFFFSKKEKWICRLTLTVVDINKDIN